MKYVLPGGSGQVGTLLARSLGQSGHDIVILSRRPSPGSRSVVWDPPNAGPWVRELEGADVVVNLAGRSVNCRYGAANRRLILESRVQSTHCIGEAIASCTRPPRVWLQASTATIYEHRYDAPNDEATGRVGGDEPGAPDTWRFSTDVARAWERAIDEIETPRTRKVKLRTAIVMSPDRGGAFAMLLALVRYGLGGRAGDGRQFVSWIHEHDFVRAVEWIVASDEIDGAVNVCAPTPLPNAELMRDLRRAWGAPFGIPAPRPLLELGAFLLRTETELLLKSRYVVPGTLLRQGFEFRFANWAAAVRELCARV